MDTPPGLQYNVHGSGSLETEVHHVFTCARNEHAYAFLARCAWHLGSMEEAITQVQALGTPLLVGTEADGEQLGVHGCLERTGAILCVSIEQRTGDRPSCRVSVAAGNMDTAVSELENIQAAFPAPDPRGRGVLPVVFWNHNAYGPDKREREIDALHWEPIAANYPQDLGHALDVLSRTEPADVFARLHLWHGPPGTGKTHAVRMLGTAWEDWCELHYITDPEQFFGSAEYMMEVVLESSDRWRLVVLEDAGEFLGADAPAATGQGFARLLNLTDGLLGHGARTMVLITTNADLRTLHPATRRAGRAASHLSFAALDAAQAATWLRAQGVTPPADLGPRTLAELYALRDERAPMETPPARRVGFA